MFNLFSYTWAFVVQAFGLFIAFAFAAIFLYMVLRRLHSRWITVILLIIFLGVSLFFFVPNGLPRGFEYPFFLRTFGPAAGPVLPLSNVAEFFKHFDQFERVPDIARNPNDIPAPIERTEPTLVKIELTAKEVISEMAQGTAINYWTFDGQIPGPFLRVREGDMVELTLHNHPTSLHHHSIDLHAVTGPGGGAAATTVAPGESKTITFKALRSGLYVYHCAEPNAANHMTHGMYGLILVEPTKGLPKVDKELYVMQGEFYTSGTLGRKGLQLFDAQAMLEGTPQYVVFNGRTKALSEGMSGEVGQTVRLFVGNGGVNLISNFHAIGEIFDRVYREGDLESEPAKNLQTTLIPAGGAAMVEFDLNYPGNYVLVDHALARVDRGAWGLLRVSGLPQPGVFEGTAESGHGH